MDDEPDTDLSGSLIGGRYRLTSLLGRGGMGAVYRGVQQDLGRPVAVKVMRPGAIAKRDGLERFRREAMTTGRLGHPNIVQVTDFGVSDDNRAFMVMELLDGRPLSAILRDESPLAPTRVASLARQICAALEAAHGAGVVHRDLKPPNVFVVPLGGGQELVKLLDFGVAKLVERDEWGRLTMTGAIIGTPAYMAPEQILGLDVDARADVFALGVLMYEALAGRRLFGSLTGMELMAAMLEREPTPLGELRPSLPPELVALVDRAMARDPESRFRSADELARALDALPLEDVPATAVAETATATTAAPMADEKPGTTPTTSPASVPAARRSGMRRLFVLGGLLALVATLGIGVLVFEARSNESTLPDERDVAPVAPVAATEPSAADALEPMQPTRSVAPDDPRANETSTRPADAAPAMMREHATGPRRSGRRNPPAPPPPRREPYVRIPDHDLGHAFSTIQNPIQPVRHAIARCLMDQGYEPEEETSDQPLTCVTLDMSAEGEVIATRHLPRGLRDPVFERCVLQKVGILNLGSSRTGEPATIDICFSVAPP